MDQLADAGIECHSIMVMRHGRVIAEGWWAPYAAERPHLLYSMTKTITALGVGIAIGDGVLALEDRIIDLLPRHVPEVLGEQAQRLTVEHLLTMTTGVDEDALGDSWTREPGDLVKGFLGSAFVHREGTVFAYDNAAAFVLARMVEAVTGEDFAHYLNARLLHPMGIRDAEWDRAASGRVFGFHGLHLTTEAVAAIGELLRLDGVWAGERLLPAGWVDRATRAHVDSRHYVSGEPGPDFHSGYGYQTWVGSEGFHANGAFGQHLLVIPERSLVVALTCGQTEVRHAPDALTAVWECLLPGVERTDSEKDDRVLAARLGRCALPGVAGERRADVAVSASVVDVAVADSAVEAGRFVSLSVDGAGWMLRIDGIGEVEIGFGVWAESAPTGRPVCAMGAWQSDAFVAHLYVVTSPHRVDLMVDPRTGTATLRWHTVPLTTSDLALHLRHPLMTRPDVS